MGHIVSLEHPKGQPQLQTSQHDHPPHPPLPGDFVSGFSDSPVLSRLPTHHQMVPASCSSPGLLKADVIFLCVDSQHGPTLVAYHRPSHVIHHWPEFFNILMKGHPSIASIDHLKSAQCAKVPSGDDASPLMTHSGHAVCRLHHLVESNLVTVVTHPQSRVLNFLLNLSQDSALYLAKGYFIELLSCHGYQPAIGVLDQRLSRIVEGHTSIG